MTDEPETNETRLNHAQRIHALEEDVIALTKRVRKLERRLIDKPPPASPLVQRVKNVFATHPDEPVMTLARCATLAQTGRQTVHRIVNSYPDVLIRGRLVPEGGLRGRPAVVVALAPRRGEARPTHNPQGAAIIWDPEP